jgi:hypothetical protein
MPADTLTGLKGRSLNRTFRAATSIAGSFTEGCRCCELVRECVRAHESSLAVREGSAEGI